MKIEWTVPALQHIREAREYIEIDNSAAAVRQVDRIEAAVNLLRAFPMMGRTGRRSGTRELPVPGTPYLLVYRVKQESVQVLAVLHGARDWQE
ncbi:MAG TPA: type II toxin-antitoxin system RelE/ParE family toxin [Acidobacteriaceae bacterium]|nr:type II toxin-antitoxin system RelE/ParE family toxin [Acidobacteriaceae bacterium]